MASLNEIYGKKNVPGLFGPELEVEYTVSKSFTGIPQGWNVKNDDSLRNFGYEFVARAPFTKEEYVIRVKELCSYLDQEGLVVDSPRTSFHLHYNVTDRTPLQIMNCIAGYWLIEDCLQDFCGTKRKGNQYCLSSSISTGVIEAVSNSINDKIPFQSFTQRDTIRYSGLNLCALSAFGSLETRVMRGDVKKPEDLIAWSLNIDKMFQFFSSFKSPADLCDAVFFNPDKFMRTALTDELFKFYRDYVVSEKLLLISDCMYSNDWEGWNSRFVVKKEKKPRPTRFEDLVAPAVAARVNNPEQNIGDGKRMRWNPDLNSFLYTRHPNPLMINARVTYEDYCIYYFDSIEEFEVITNTTEQEYREYKHIYRDFLV